MGIGDIRYTLLQTVNEVQRKLGLTATGTVADNKFAIELVDFVNDVCADLSDFGNWQETLVSANVSAVGNQSDYSISTSANIKNIGDIYFVGSATRTGPLRNVTVADMRILTRSSSLGTPHQFTIFGTDNNGNPNLRVSPTPSSAVAAGAVFSITAYTLPPRYTTSDGALVIPYPARVVVIGTYAKAVLYESGGTPSDKYAAVQQEYLLARKEALNRFNGDTGWYTSFAPSVRRRR